MATRASPNGLHKLHAMDEIRTYECNSQKPIAKVSKVVTCALDQPVKRDFSVEIVKVQYKSSPD